MSRMLEALKVLETRQRREQEPVAAPPSPSTASRADDLVAELQGLVAAEIDDFCAPAPQTPATPAQATAPQPTVPQLSVPQKVAPLPRAPQARPQFETCKLPLVSEPAECYLELAGRIGEQLAVNYCNVVLFVGVDRWEETAFSMTHLAQAFAQQAGGDVLLVDGDLRRGSLSKSVARPGAGMIEAMLGRAQWPEIIHPTNAGRIDFVARGNAQVPTVERTEFGWSSLRPLYRAVLIGMATAAEPETSWLAGRCDAVYLLISRPHTRRSAASAAINSLRGCGANVVGSIVVND